MKFFSHMRRWLLYEQVKDEGSGCCVYRKKEKESISLEQNNEKEKQITKYSKDTNSSWLQFYLVTVARVLYEQSWREHIHLPWMVMGCAIVSSHINPAISQPLPRSPKQVFHICPLHLLCFLSVYLHLNIFFPFAYCSTIWGSLPSIFLGTRTLQSDIPDCWLATPPTSHLGPSAKDITIVTNTPSYFSSTVSDFQREFGIAVAILDSFVRYNVEHPHCWKCRGWNIAIDYPSSARHRFRTLWTIRGLLSKEQLRFFAKIIVKGDNSFSKNSLDFTTSTEKHQLTSNSHSPKTPPTLLTSWQSFLSTSEPI